MAARTTATVVSRRFTFAIRTSSAAAAASVWRSCQIRTRRATRADARDTSQAATSRQKIVSRCNISITFDNLARGPKPNARPRLRILTPPLLHGRQGLFRYAADDEARREGGRRRR